MALSRWLEQQTSLLIFAAFALKMLTFATCSELSNTATIIGKCGSKYTEPKELVWLTNIADECMADSPCSYTIEAPIGTIIQLSFTSLSGLKYPEINSSATNVYDLIEGESTCQPRIEVTETYTEAGNVQVTRHKTLCYDRRLFESSVVIQSRSRTVLLSVYCLARKYSFFSMNFVFITPPEMCNSSLECHGRCVQAGQVCDGVRDCSSGEDEMNCDPLADMTVTRDRVSKPGELKNGVILIVVLTVLVLLVLVTVVLLCSCYRRFRGASGSQFESPTQDYLTTACWAESERTEYTDGSVSTPTQQLLGLECDGGASQRRTASTTNNRHSAADSIPPESSPEDIHRKQQAALMESMSLCRPIRSRDGERGYEDHEYELRNAQLLELKYKDTIGEGLPRNVTITLNEDGTQEYPVQKHWLMAANCSYSKSTGNNQPPPPYSQFNSGCGGTASVALSSPSSLYQQNSCSHLHIDDRRESCASYSSHKSEPPSYEMAVNIVTDNGADRNNCPHCQQSL